MVRRLTILERVVHVNEFYLIDSPTYTKLEGLKKEYENLDIISVMLYLEINKAYKIMKSKYDKFIEEYDLSEAKFSILMLLSYEENMTLSPSDLSKKIGNKKSTITGLVKGLEKQGLIRRVNLSNDKGSSYVQMTEIGYLKLKEFLPNNYDFVSNIFSDFDEQEKETFFHLMNKLRNKIEEDGENE